MSESCKNKSSRFRIYAVNAASTVFPTYDIKLCNWHYPKNLREYASSKCSIHLFNDNAFRKWLKTLIGASHLPLEWMEQVVDHLLSHPPTIHQALMIHFNKFVDYYRRQWRQKLKFINYQNPGIQELMLYSVKQAYCTTEDFPAAEADRRFDIQDQPLQQQNPRPQHQPINHQQQFVHPFFGVQNFVEVQQMLQQPLRPQFFQHPQNLMRFHRPQNQQPFNLNMSLPVQNQQFQQYLPQFYYNHRPPF